MLRFLNIVLFTAAVGCGIGYLSFYALPADYRSTARLVLVGPSGATNQNKASQPQPTDSQPTESQPTDSQSPESAANQAGAAQAREDRIAQARRALTDTSTLERALGNSILIGLNQPSGLPLSLEQVAQSLSFDNTDEPADVLVLHCHAPTAELPPAILSSVIDAYFVRCSQQSQAASARTEQTLQRARRLVQEMQGGAQHAAQLRSLVDSLGKPLVDASGMAKLSLQRSDLILRRNRLRQQFTELSRGKPSAEPEDPRQRVNRASAPKAAQPPASALGLGTEERVVQLLEEDRKLSSQYGANHPKRKALRLQLDLLRRYPPEQAHLLGELWTLQQQYGPNHPQLKEIRERLAELGVAPLEASDPAVSDEPASPRSTEASPVPAEDTTQAQLDSVRAALQKLDEQDHELTQTVEAINRTRDMADELQQAVRNLPATGNLQTIDAALDRLAQLNAAQSELHPYLAMRPTPAQRSQAGLNQKLLSGGGVGAVVGLVLALVMVWARSTNRSPV